MKRKCPNGVLEAAAASPPNSVPHRRRLLGRFAITSLLGLCSLGAPVVIGAGDVANFPPAVMLAQELPKQESDSFEVEPPLLIPPTAARAKPGEKTDVTSVDIPALTHELEQARKSALAAARLVQAGVLAKTESEQRALRVVRLEAELAKAQKEAVKAEVTLQTAQGGGAQNSNGKEAALAALSRANAAAQEADEKYHQALIDAAALNLRRQRQLLARGSAHRSDVSRAEEKLDRLQRGDEAAEH